MKLTQGGNIQFLSLLLPSQTNCDEGPRIELAESCLDAFDRNASQWIAMHQFFATSLFVHLSLIALSMGEKSNTRRSIRAQYLKLLGAYFVA